MKKIYYLKILESSVSNGKKRISMVYDDSIVNDKIGIAKDYG